jgi:hypothetical protein
MPFYAIIDYYKQTRKLHMMKKLSIITAVMLLGATLHAEESVDTAVDTAESASILKNWNFNILIEDRIFSDKTSQTLLKLQADTSVTEKISFFSGVWLRDQLPVYAIDTHPHLDGKSEYINYVDIFAGLSYDLHQYFNPYIFLEVYYDKPDPTNQWGTFAAAGFSGTLYSENKHNISYYTEWYFTLDTYDLDAGKFWATESALKYKYNIYEQTALYVQAVWNTDTDEDGYGLTGYSDGIYSTRVGIQIDF